MDNLTHSLVGALIGQAGLKKKTGLAMPALIIGANLPDVDAACFFWLDGAEHLGFRRGITHGPPALVLLPLMLAAILYGFDRWQAKRGKRPEGRLPANFKWLFALSFIGCLTHPALDWLNVYGIRLLEPFSSQWFYGDTLFIIDVWLWALMGFATWFSLRLEKQDGEWRKPARVAMMVAMGYIGLNWAITNFAETRWDPVAQWQFATVTRVGPDSIEKTASPDLRIIANPLPFAFWEREVIFGKRGEWRELQVFGGDQIFTPGLSTDLCRFPSRSQLPSDDSQLDAFLFWSRAPFAERAADGSVILRDARFYDPRARDRFSVALPDVKCLPLAQSSP